MTSPAPMPAYFVLVSPAYGGAEKRFFDIFRAMRRTGANVKMIAPSSLANRLLADHPDQPELASALVSIPMDSWSPLTFVRLFRRLLKSIPRGASFHYPMNCLWPLHLGRGDTVSMSVTNCINVPGPQAANRSAKWTWASFFFVRRVDVLSPQILSRMTDYRTAPKMSLTPGGTFIEVLPEADVAKAPTVALLSRLIDKKGIDDWLDVLPGVWDRLQSRVPAGFSFTIAGYGPRQDHFEQRIAALAAQGVPVTFSGYANAIDFLPRVSVVLSMQEVTNYPSRVVAEALVSGCGVIVRDTGDSRQFGEDLPGLVYCQAKLDAAELADQIAGMLAAFDASPGYADKIRQSGIARFSAAASVDYFAGMLYPAPQ
jgi:glycosyltransferase involved in cell wall biosynthesis